MTYPIFGRQGHHSGGHISFTAAAAFYSANSRQGLGLGGLASRGGPVLGFENNDKARIS